MVKVLGHPSKREDTMSVVQFCGLKLEIWTQNYSKLIMQILKVITLEEIKDQIKLLKYFFLKIITYSVSYDLSANSVGTGKDRHQTVKIA